MKDIVKRIYQYIRYGIPVNTQIFANIQDVNVDSILTGRTALITGGSSGIGFAIARKFLQAGAIVIITGRNEDKIAVSVKSLKKEGLGKVYGIKMDMTQVSSIVSGFASIRELVGDNIIDILVNNAGINGSGFLSCTEEEYDNVLDTNLKGPFFLTQSFVKYLLEKQQQGNILNIVSSSGIRPAYNSYTISKWGFRGFTEGIARMLAPYGIVVNGIAPGPTATSMQGKFSENDEITLNANLAGRMALPHEIADMAVMLVSNSCRTIIGDIVYMSGGGGNITNEDISYSLQ